jgi:carbamate kinase
MGATAVVALRCGECDLADVAGSVRALALAGWKVVVTAPSGDVAGPLSLALGLTRAGRRAIPIVTHTLVDPLDPAFAHPPMTVSPEPLAILESEAIGALLDKGFPVVVTGHVPVVPHGDDYREVEAALDGALAAQRLASDLGASALVFVVDDEERLADRGASASELKASERFVAAGGEEANVATAAHLVAAVEGQPTPSSTMAKISATAPIRSIDDVTSGIPWLSGSSPRR